MKLLYCPRCEDVFKLSLKKVRQCDCGMVKGRYINHLLAETNGKGIHIAIGNGSLINAIGDMERLQRITKDEADRDEYYKSGKGRISHAWVRPQSGNGNPHTIVNETL